MATYFRLDPRKSLGGCGEIMATAISTGKTAYGRYFGIAISEVWEGVSFSK
jgi:hypothetical protein